MTANNIVIHRYTRPLFIIPCLVSIALFCVLPEDRSLNPENVQLTILPVDTTTDTLTIGDSLSFNVKIELIRLMDSLRIEVGTGYDSVYTDIAETISVTMQPDVPGNLPIYVTGYCRNDIVKNASDTFFVMSIPVKITEEPFDTAVFEGDSALFFIAVSGNPAPTIQWFLDSAAVDDATGDTLLIKNTSMDMDGNLYRARVANSIDTVWTERAVLFVSTVVFRWNEMVWDKAIWR